MTKGNRSEAAKDNSNAILMSILNGLDAYVYVTDPTTDEILFINDKMLEHYELEGNIVGEKCYKVLQSDLDCRCDFCPNSKLTSGETDVVVWEEHSTLTGRYYKNTDRLIDWINGTKAHLQHSADITDLKIAQKDLRHRLLQQEIIAEVSRSFISNTNINELLDNALRLISQFLGGVTVEIMKYDALNKTFIRENNFDFYDDMNGLPIILDAQNAEGFINDMVSGVVCINDVSAHFDTYISHEILEPLKVKSCMVAPIYIERNFGGVIIAENHIEPVVWSDDSIKFLKLLSSIISVAMSRHFIERNLHIMSSIVEKSPYYISCVSSDGLFKYVNGGALSMTGYFYDEVIGKNISTVYGDEIAKNITDELIPKITDDGFDEYGIEFERRDGVKRTILFTTFRIIDNGENAYAAIGKDITDELILKQELVAAKNQAVNSSKSKSEFLSRMSHEMRTPMNAIIGMTNIAKMSNELEKKEYCLGKIENASKHLLGVINDILDMSKIEADKFELAFIDFEFERMISSVASVVNFKIEEKKQTFIIDIDPDVPEIINSDEQRFSQIITNLLSNAVKFTPESGAIRFSAKKNSETDDKCTLRIEVSDNGIGISEEQQKKLFASFEQANGGISRKFGGTGLGLAISKKIVELMNGKIWIESELGKGSHFIFTVEVGKVSVKGKEKQYADPKENDIKSDCYLGRHILLAEDVEINREIIDALLSDTGVKLDFAENGLIAYNMFLAEPNRYDLILMDIHMPEVDGYESCRMIRSMNTEEAKSIPIVAMTANVFREDIEKCMQAGMNNHIGKPIDLDELYNKLDMYLL